MWVKQKSDPQPCTEINIQAIPSDTNDMGVPPKFDTPTPVIKMKALADTGCQSMLAGTNLLRNLNLQQNQLIAVTMKMTAANSKGIDIIGALPLRISGRTLSGTVISTRQLVYFTPATTKLFLSKEACQKLGLISKYFPSIGENLGIEEDHKKPESAITRDCNCPKRTMPPPLPKTIPFSPTEENRGKLEGFLLEYYKSSTFNTCEHQTLPMMNGPPLRLMIDANAKPFAVHKPIPIPIHWQEDIYEGLKQDERLGVIEAVPVGTPVTWCHRMVTVPKKSGKPRRTVDLQPLNKYAIRETHHTETPFHQARSVPRNTYKTVTDAWNGYHSIPLHQDDRHFTTFITPKGRFRYKVAPQGYVSSGDGYTRRFDEIVTDVPQKTKCVDDTLLWEYSLEEAFWQTVKWLDLCGRNGIILNPVKFVFASKTVEFAGFQITATSVKPSLRCLEAIENFPTPKNITDVRSWFGLINQVSYAFASAERMLPLRALLKPGKPFEWNEKLDELFNESKAIIIEDIRNGVEIFDKSRPTCLATDWCKDGIGFWLLQKHCSCQQITPLCCRSGWKIVLVGSRFTTKTESRYAPIEGEALAVVDALKKARHFVLGCKDLIIAVDHKPLLKVFSDRSLHDINNTRLLNLKEKTLQFRFNIIHVPGIRHAAADALSRHPTSSPKETPDVNEAAALLTNASPHDFLMSIRGYKDERLTQVCNTNCPPSHLIETVSWDSIREETSSDPIMCKLVEHIESGFPDNRGDLIPELGPYFQYRNNLSTFDGVALYNQRVIIPPSLREKVLVSLHSAHQGTSQMCSRAESSIFWPGITPAIANIRNQCTACNRIAPSQPNAPPIAPIMPLYPFQAIAADYFHYGGKQYLVAVDRYSNWPMVERSANGSKGLITALKKIFITFGISEELTSDGGTEFTSHETRKFLNNWGVHHRMSSAYFPHSNTRAEIGVKTIKRLIMDNSGSDGSLDTDKFQRAILQYRNTPDRDTGLSPAMCVFGRVIRDFIPVHPGRYLPHPTWRQTLHAREEALRNRHEKTCERLTEHTQRLPPLKVGDHVRVQNQYGPHSRKWDKTAIVIEVRQYNQYIIKIDGSGRVSLRNRKFLRKYTPVVGPKRHNVEPNCTPISPNIPNSAIPPSSLSPCVPEPHKPHSPKSPPEIRSLTRIFRPSISVNSQRPAKPVKPVTPTVSLTPQENQITPPEPHSLPEAPSIQPDSPGSPKGVNTKSQRLPLALKRLETYNTPGLSERPIQTAPDKYTTRQSTRLLKQTMSS